jgi:hypothetical protein
MGFFSSLTRALGTSSRSAGDRERLAEAWGVSDTGDAELADAGPGGTDAPPETLDYDRVQWRRKLKRILERLPASEHEWDPMITEARALAFDDEWVACTQLQEFDILMRRAVADCTLTEAEHEKLDLARRLIGLSEQEAETLLATIVKEAETFFGHHVEGA